MAKTRGELKTLVIAHTGRNKDTLMDSLCNDALKIAVMLHAFRDSLSIPSDFAITEAATSVDISSASALHIVTARIVQTSGSQNKKLIIKDRQWWDRKVINPEDNQKGWPTYGLRWGDNIVLDRPANSGLSLRLRVTTVPAFADDSTECPISVLDLFVEKYVAAHVFLSMENRESYIFWKSEALGPAFDRGSIGGELLNAINSDKYDPAQELKVERASDVSSNIGISVENQITGHGRFGEVDTWY